MVIPDPSTIAKITTIGANILSKAKKKKKKLTKNAEGEESGEVNEVKDPFAAKPATGQPVQIKQRVKRIFGK